jgi:hypothetical protein
VAYFWKLLFLLDLKLIQFSEQTMYFLSINVHFNWRKSIRLLVARSRHVWPIRWCYVSHKNLLKVNLLSSKLDLANCYNLTYHLTNVTSHQLFQGWMCIFYLILTYKLYLKTEAGIHRGKGSFILALAQHKFYNFLRSI